MESYKNYGFMDRMVHKIAFGTQHAQNTLCDMESRLYDRNIAQQQVERPIFVTALPRAGTTLLLEILSRHPDVVTHTYRDMPFVLSPVIWRQLMGRFQIRLSKRERAHSDGIMVDTDSPEAFEEVLWLRSFPGDFRGDGIALRQGQTPDIRKQMTDLIIRLIASRSPNGPGALRYVSKNNANIARLASLKEAFPDAHFLVPLRHPIDHAISMHKQHIRFLEIHHNDKFAKSYMRDIGHFEFGALHKPILFDGMQDVIAQYDPKSLDYWIAYWIKTYVHLAGVKGALFLDMEDFTAKASVEPLLAALGLGEDRGTIDFARTFIKPIKRYSDVCAKSENLSREAVGLYEEIRRKH